MRDLNRRPPAWQSDVPTNRPQGPGFSNSFFAEEKRNVINVHKLVCNNYRCKIVVVIDQHFPFYAQNFKQLVLFRSPYQILCFTINCR